MPSQTPGSLDLTTSPRRSVLTSDLALSESSSAVSTLDSSSSTYPVPSRSSELPISGQLRPQSAETGTVSMDFTPEPGTSSDSSLVAMDMTPRRSNLQFQPSSGSDATEYSITGENSLRPGSRSNSIQSSSTGTLDVLSVGPSLGSSDTAGYSQSTGLSQSLPDSDNSLLENTRNETRSLDLSTSGSSEPTASVDTLGSLDLTKTSSVPSSQPHSALMSSSSAPPPYVSPVSSAAVAVDTSEQASTSRMGVLPAPPAYFPPVSSNDGISESVEMEAISADSETPSSSTSVATAPPPYLPVITTSSVDSSEQPSTSAVDGSFERSRSSASLGQPDANTAIVDMDLVGANENVANTVVIETSQGPSASNR